MNFTVIALTSVLTTSVSFAQATTNPNSAKKPNSIRVLAVGEPPISKVTMLSNSLEERVAQEIEVPAESLPPKTLFISKAEKKNAPRTGSEKEEERAKIPISLGCMSPSITLKTSLTDLQFRESEEESQNYFKASFPVGTKNGLVILSKPHSDKTWKKPRLLFLSDDLTAFPQDSVRIINSSSYTMGLIIGDQKLSFKPGQVKTLPLKANSTIPYQVAIQSKDGGWVRIRNTALTLPTGQRVNLVLSNRPSNPHKPAKVNLFAETPPSPSPAKDLQARN
ncbi:hypothetical protein SAMN02745181_2823 [Rubritalea squalenifaciens DSM 18772]|uniref:P pilus assembly protein, chaperone PapD n=1 Tax=Rubritalea squalenifaciens DSM 18772 TaxID=1123071 RepID=A0A1M6NDC4_9BACT|nr:hypothetical protein [Rubritalea squalenifaciens]SHJ93752.1 hypothetical protein SAMN02745181_2823 [Rubritalea squalenifaciens DSM 18772]